MPKEYDNPPGRLLTVLRSAIALGSSKNQALHEMWANVLQIEQNDRTIPRVYAQLSQLCDLIDETEELIAATIDEDRRELYLRCLPELRKGLVPPNIQNNWNGIQQHFSPAVMTGLEFCAADLPKEHPITKEEINEVYAQFEELFQQVKGSGLNPTLRKWLLTLLAQAKSSIDLYRIQGARAFKRALRDVVGDVMLYKQAFPEVQKDPAVFDQLMAFLNKINGLAQRAEEWKPLLEYGTTSVAALLG